MSVSKMYDRQARCRQEVDHPQARAPFVVPDPEEKRKIEAFRAAGRKPRPWPPAVPDDPEEHIPDTGRSRHIQKYRGVAACQPRRQGGAVVSIHDPGLARDQLLDTRAPLLW